MKTSEVVEIPFPVDAQGPVVLVVDDNTGQRLTAAHFLRQQLNIEVEESASGAAALKRLAEPNLPTVEMVLLDYRMPDMDGRETLRRIRLENAGLPVIMLTASNELEDAVTLMREGANDFIVKPFNPERLRLSVEQHLTIRTLRQEVARLKRAHEKRDRFNDMIGAEGGLSDTITLARKAAGSDINVLISGESGTGKELLARAIHGESARGGKPFIAINCGAIPENLVESILFGHEKGSFTGAIARELGKFREAEGGTLFLDEIGEFKPDMQTRLLRALQQREIEPVGAGKSVSIDVRILAATHRRLADDVKTGRFREDLYFRLNVLPIALPPLRERKTDIAQLALSLLTRFCASEGKPQMKVTQAGLDWLQAQPWPGNVRELENLLYRAVVLSDKNELGPEDFITMTRNAYASELRGEHESLALLDATGRAYTLEEMEAQIVAWALKRCSGQVKQAAKLLGMGQSTLYKKLES